jgi:hypothetical protein
MDVMDKEIRDAVAQIYGGTTGSGSCLPRRRGSQYLLVLALLAVLGVGLWLYVDRDAAYLAVVQRTEFGAKAALMRNARWHVNPGVNPPPHCKLVYVEFPDKDKPGTAQRLGR